MPNVVAVIPLYRPDVRILNRCLAHVLPQVSRVILATEGKSLIPADVTQDHRISISHTGREGIGFGANVNQGASKVPESVEWLLILNDDVFLNEDAVACLLAAATPSTGLVVHLLRYPDRRVFATVCARNSGDMDFHHVDQLAFEPSIKTIIEVENACGASWLIRHYVWRELGGYDESWFCYCEDNDLSMRVRQAGYRLIYTPHAKGWHVGHQSTRLLGNLDDLIRPSVARFHARWHDYLEWNKYIVPGNFDYMVERESSLV